MPVSKQESRPERVSMAVTREEKRAVRWLASTRETTESEVLRTTLVGDALAEWQRVKLAA